MSNKILAANAFILAATSFSIFVVTLFFIVIPSLGHNPFMAAAGITMMAVEVGLTALGILLFALALRLVRADAKADDSSE